MLYSVVLAGGRSSRMGRDKALLEAAGKTLLERALDLLQRSGADRILISGKVEGYDCIPDLMPFNGPPGGLYSTLHQIREEFGLDGSPLLLIPVDMPRLNPDVLARAVVSLGEARALHYENEVFPCVFRVTEALYAHLREIFAEGSGPEPGGRRSMKGLLAWAGAKAIPKAGIPEEVFMNVNDPKEWEAFLGSL